MVLAADGKLVMDDVIYGFGEAVKQQIRKYLKSTPAVSEPENEKSGDGKLAESL